MREVLGDQSSLISNIVCVLVGGCLRDAGRAAVCCAIQSLLLRDRLWGAALLPTHQEHLCERAALRNLEEDWLLLLFARRWLGEDLESTVVVDRRLRLLAAIPE